jgi:hypothetical protein
MLRKICGANFFHIKFLGRTYIKCQNGSVVPPAQVWYFNGHAYVIKRFLTISSLIFLQIFRLPNNWGRGTRVVPRGGTAWLPRHWAEAGDSYRDPAVLHKTWRLRRLLLAGVLRNWRRRIMKSYQRISPKQLGILTIYTQHRKCWFVRIVQVYYLFLS